HENGEESRRRRIERATVADAADADRFTRNGDHIERGPTRGLVHQENARGSLAVQATPVVARALASASRAPARIGSRTSASVPLTSAPAARTCPPPPQRDMSAAASTEGAHADVRHDTFTLPCCSLKRSATRTPLERASCSTSPLTSSSCAPDSRKSDRVVSLHTSIPSSSRFIRENARPQRRSDSKRLLR